jgi:hypothetical protein
LDYGEVEARGKFSIQGNELTWETDSYCDQSDAGKATYIWTYENDILQLQVKGKDKCSERYRRVDNFEYKKEQ